MRAMLEPGYGPAWPRLGAGLLMLCLVAHLAADLAWLYQHSAGAIEMPSSSALSRTDQAVVDPHGEGLLSSVVTPAGCLALVLALWMPLGRAAAFVRAPLLHPPAVRLIHS